MFKVRLWAIIIILIGAGLGFLVYKTEQPDSNFNFKFGLDLDGGTHLTYSADTSGVKSGDISGAMDSLRKTVERRINIFGVSEPIVQVETGGLFSEDKNANRLIVELPGITDVNQAVEMIGKTPILEFRLAGDPAAISALSSAAASSTTTPEEISKLLSKAYIQTGITGSQLQKATLVFGQGTTGPTISLTFNEEGKKLFAEITKNNIGKVMAIFLDGKILSAPTIQDEIPNGQAQITGQFTAEEGKQLVQDLNYGALPLPIKLIETQSIGATLGTNTLNAGVMALVYALIAVFIFVIFWYRLPGIVACIALVFYVILNLLAFKFIPVVLTASGIAGLVLSVGMAVDANILIFERIKEEIRKGLSTFDAVNEGTKRAWPSIRDGNLTSLISAVILFWLSGAAVVKGFALVYGIGILISMISAIIISRLLLLAISSKKSNKLLEILFGTGFGKIN
jgi:protein-export membrane protein SecD